MANGFVLKEQEFLKINEELDMKTKKLLQSDSCNNLNKFGGKKSTSKVKRTVPKPRMDSPDSDDQESNAVYANLPQLLACSAPKEDRQESLPLKPRGWHSKSNTLPKERREPLHPASKKMPEPLQCLHEQTEDDCEEEKLLNSGSNRNVLQLVESTSGELGYEAQRNEAYHEALSVVEDLNLEQSARVPRVSEPFARPVKTVKPIKATNLLNHGPPVSNKKYRSPSSVQDPLPKKNLSSDGLIKFLKGKVVILQDELEKCAGELQKAVQEVETSLECQKKIENQRDQAISRNNTLTGNISKLEEKLLDVERRLKDREHEFLTANRELEVQKREIRVVTQNNANLEKRLYRSNEELETTKAALSIAKENEREVKEQLRQSQEIHEKHMKNLRKQKTELLSAYKKQLYLIDNLKRRNVCLEQAKLIGFSEKEFNKILEWNAKE